MAIEYELSREEYIKKKEAEKSEIIQKLEDGVKAVFSSEKYKDFLSAYGRFHDYSINNTILILMQNPAATHVASFRTWKALGRYPKKGSKAIKVLVPIPYKYEKEVEAENGEIETKEYQGTSFRIGSVFDIANTDGRELPSLVCELTENSEDIKRAIDTIIQTADVPVYFDKSIKGDAKGYYHIEDKYIAIRPEMSDSQTFKTLIHELVHSKYHGKDDNYSMNERELQAESVAHIVCSRYGIDSSKYSFGYLAAYSKDKSIKELKDSLGIIQRFSDDIIKSIDKSLGIKSIEEIAKKRQKNKER